FVYEDFELAQVVMYEGIEDVVNAEARGLRPVIDAVQLGEVVKLHPLGVAQEGRDFNQPVAIDDDRDLVAKLDDLLHRVREVLPKDVGELGWVVSTHRQSSSYQHWFRARSACAGREACQARLKRCCWAAVCPARPMLPSRTPAPAGPSRAGSGCRA